MSQILTMDFCLFTTRGHSPITWTFTLHSIRSLIDCISHHPLHQHSCSHWSRLHLFTISQSPSPNHTHTHTHTHTHYISSGLSPTLCEVLFLPRLTFLSVSPFFWFWFLCLTPDCPDTLNLCLWPRLLPGTVYVSALPLIFLFLPADHCLFILPLSNKYMLHLDPHASDQSLQWLYIIILHIILKIPYFVSIFGNTILQNSCYMYLL